MVFGKYRPWLVAAHLRHHRFFLSHFFYILLLRWYHSSFESRYTICHAMIYKSVSSFLPIGKLFLSYYGTPAVSCWIEIWPPSSCSAHWWPFDHDVAPVFHICGPWTALFWHAAFASVWFQACKQSWLAPLGSRLHHLFDGMLRGLFVGMNVSLNASHADSFILPKQLLLFKRVAMQFIISLSHDVTPSVTIVIGDMIWYYALLRLLLPFAILVSTVLWILSDTAISSQAKVVVQ